MIDSSIDRSIDIVSHIKLNMITDNTGALSLGIKQPGREADHSPSFSAEVKECMEL